MKTTLVILGLVAGLAVSGCQTAHDVKNGTVSVAKDTGHAIGHGTKKVGNSIAKGGQKLENKTDQ